MIKHRILLILWLAFGLSACSTVAESDVAGAAATSEAIDVASLPDDADPAIWVVKDEDTTIYLFGTVHLLKPGMTWFDEAIKDAFDSSDELVIEMIPPDPAAMVKIVNDLAIDKTGVSLRDKLAPADRAKFEAAMTQLKLPVESFDALDPWFASVNLSLIPLMANGYQTERGVENDLRAQAEVRKIEVIGLETAEQQLGFFDGLPEEVQVDFLNFTVGSLDTLTDGMEDMVIQWANANVDALAELMNAGLEDKILYDTLLANRNATWADWVEGRLEQPGTVFMAVGAGHLAGEASLQVKLNAKDIVAQRIEY